MEIIQVLLVDTCDTIKKILERESPATEKTKFRVALVNPRGDQNPVEEAAHDADAVVFGEKVPQSTVVHCSRSIRHARTRVPIFVLTRQSEAGVPRNYQRAGVDDMLNVVEMDSPLFLWSFVSTLRQAEMKKKAREFDTLQNRLKSVKQTLAFITHEINNPLSVIRLALFHLDNPGITKGRRDMLFKLLSENVQKVDVQVEELRGVRRFLGDTPSAPRSATAVVLPDQKVA